MRMPLNKLACQSLPIATLRVNSLRINSAGRACHPEPASVVADASMGEGWWVARDSNPEPAD